MIQKSPCIAKDNFINLCMETFESPCRLPLSSSQNELLHHLLNVKGVENVLIDMKQSDMCKALLHPPNFVLIQCRNTLPKFCRNSKDYNLCRNLFHYEYFGGTKNILCPKK